MGAASKPASGSRATDATRAHIYATTARASERKIARGILSAFSGSARYASMAAADTLASARRKLASGCCSRLILSTNGAASEARVSKKARGWALRMLWHACWGGGGRSPQHLFLHAQHLMQSALVEHWLSLRVALIGALEVEGVRVD